MANLPVDRICPEASPLVPDWANQYADGFPAPKTDGTFAKVRAKPVETNINERLVSFLIMFCLPGYVKSVRWSIKLRNSAFYKR